MSEQRRGPRAAGGRAVRRPPLIWARVLCSRRGKPALDYDGIVRAALRVADAEGSEGLSMRRIADELGAGTMSLYRYLSSKEDLLDLMLDAAFGEIALPARPGDDWRADLRALARATRRMLKQHPWLGPLLTSRPPLGPNYLRWFEFSLAVLARRGVGTRVAMQVVGTLYAYVSGVVGYELGEAETSRRHGLSEARKRALAAPYLKGLLASGRFPNLARFVRQGTGRPTESAFEFGLDCVLEGLELALRREVRSTARGRRP
jgi:AcrR family transcriptional regulator